MICIRSSSILSNKLSFYHGVSPSPTIKDKKADVLSVSPSSIILIFGKECEGELCVSR